MSSASSLFHQLATGNYDALQGKDAAELEPFLPLLACTVVDRPELLSLYEAVYRQRGSAIAMRFAAAELTGLSAGAEPLERLDAALEQQHLREFELCEARASGGEARQAELALLHLRWLHQALTLGRPAAGLFCHPALRAHLTAIVPIVLRRRPELMPAGDALQALLLLDDSRELVSALVCSLPGVWSDLKDVLVAAVGSSATHGRAVEAALWIVNAMGRGVALELRDALQGVTFGCHLAMQLTLAHDAHPIQWAAAQAFGSKAHRKWLLNALSSPSSVSALAAVGNSFRRRLWHTGRSGAPASILALHLATTLVVGGLRPSAEDAALWVASLAALPTDLPISPSDLMLCFLHLLLLLRSELPLNQAELHSALCTLLDLSPTSQRPKATAVWVMLQLQRREWGSLAAALRAAASVKVAFPETAFTVLAAAAADAGLLQLEPAASFVSAAIQVGPGAGHAAEELLLLESWEVLLRLGHCRPESPAAFLRWAAAAGANPAVQLVRLASTLAGCAPKGALLPEAELLAACGPGPMQQMRMPDSKGAALVPLALFYAMEAEAAFRKNGGSLDGPTAAAAQSWHAMVARLPVREAACRLLGGRAPGGCCEALLPAWVALAASVLPSQMDTLDADGCGLGDSAWRAGLEVAAAREGGSRLLGETELAAAAHCLAHAAANPLAATQLLHRLRLCSDRAGTAELSPAAELVVRELAPLLGSDAELPLTVEAAFVGWWRSLPPAVSRPLLPHLVDRLSGDEPAVEDDGGEGRFRLAPAAVLRVAAATWRRPVIAGLLLTQLVAALGECRAEAKLLTDQGAQDALAPEELHVALLVQDSAVVQMLLEAVLALQPAQPSDAEAGHELGNGGGLTQEVQARLLETLHTLFVRQPALVKLVHFQGYSPELLPVMVASVPSMETCVEFLEELLQSGDRDVALFGCQLTGQLSTKYRQHSMMGAARRALYRCQGASSAGNLAFVAQSLEALGQLACAFPALCKEVVMLLQACVQCGGREGERRSVEPASCLMESRLAEEAVRTFEMVISNLVLHGSTPACTQHRHSQQGPDDLLLFLNCTAP
eukprot:jgi/Tetstr1/423465/TSEL_014146.t1